jgi:hypothetical protein
MYTPAVHTSVFKPGEEYIYHYKGQVLSGIPKSSKQFAGIVLDSIVKLQFQQDYKVLMKMEKIKLFKVNNKINNVPSEHLELNEMTRLTGEQEQVILRQLVKPVKFSYEEGQIHSVEKEMGDEYWSLNIKKGLLSLFQVTLKDNTQYSSSSDPLLAKLRSSYRPSSYNKYTPVTPYWKLVSKSNSVYKVMETDVMGTCETKYSLVSDDEHISPSSRNMYVSSVRDFNNCINKPFVIEGLFQGIQHFSHEKSLIEPSVHTDYVITGDRTHFLIKQATLRGKYMFLINGLEGADLSTHVLQQITLKSVEPITQAIRLQTPSHEPKGLEMYVPKSKVMFEDKEQQPEYYQSSYYKQQSSSYMYEKNMEEPSVDITPVAEEKLNELIECLYPSDIEKKCSEKLYELTRICTEMNKQQLKSIIIRHIQQSHSNEINYRKSEIMLDMLSTLTTPESAKLIIELVKERHLSDLRASLMTKAMSMTVQPTPSVIKSLLELFKELPKERESTISTKTMLRQSVLLSVGTLTNKLINVMKHEMSKPVPQIITFVDTVSNELVRMLEETGSESEKILVLKCIGNMGSSVTIETLKKYIEDVQQPPVVRANAIYALRRLVKQFKKQVTPILLNIYMDVKELRELRQASFVVLINSAPSYVTLQMIGHKLRHEPMSQLRTLVYSTLVNLATYTSHQPEHKQLVKDARLVLKTVRPVHIGLHDSMFVNINKFSEEFDLGGALSLTKIKSKFSGLPEALIANLQTTVFGKHRSIVEVGAEGKALEKMISKLFGVNGLVSKFINKEISVEQLFEMSSFSPVEMSADIQQKIRSVLTKLMYESDKGEFGSYSGVYIHLLSNELQYIIINSENIQEIYNKVERMLPELMIKLSQGIKVDIIKTFSHISTLTLPSPLGLPLSLNWTAMALLKVDGFVKINELPTWSELINNRLEAIPKLGLEIDIKPTVDITHYLSTGVDMKWLSVGCGAALNVKAHKPLKFLTQLEPLTHSLTIKYFPSKQSLKTLYVRATPATFVKYIPINVNKLPFVLERNEIHGEHIVKNLPFNYQYELSTTGQEWRVEGMLSVCGPTWCPIVPLFGKQEISVYTRPIFNVEYITLKIKSTTHNMMFEGVPEMLTPEQIFTKNTEELEREQMYTTNNQFRTEGRSVIVPGEFDEVSVDPIFSTSLRPIKRQIFVSLSANTMHTPAVKALFTWLMDRETPYLKHQFNIQLIRQPYSDTPAWKVNVNNVLNGKQWYPSEMFGGEEESFLNKLTLTWNIYGHSNALKIKIVPGSPFDFTRELSEHSIIPSSLTDKLPEATSYKFKYSIFVDTPKMTPRLYKYVMLVQDFIKYQLYNKLATTLPAETLNNKMIISVEVIPWWEKMNVIVKTPHESSYISAVPLHWNPFLSTPLIRRLHDTEAWTWYNQTSMYNTVPYQPTPIFSGECVSTPNKLETFDGARLPMFTLKKLWRETSGELVLVQHCNSESPLFSVIASSKNQQPKLKVLLPKYEVELIKNPGSSYQPITLLVNGEVKSLPIGQPITLPEHSSTQSRPVKNCEIEQTESGIFVIHSQLLRLTVVVNGNEDLTKIKVSPLSMLQGQLCGLCGNFNQDQSDDMPTTWDFESSWGSKTSDDFVNYVKKNMLNSEYTNMEQIMSTNSNFCKKTSILKINRYDDEKLLTCTSEVPVVQCEEGCRPHSTRSVKTCFTCNSPQRYMSPSWTTDSEVTCADFFERVEVPTRCVPVY